MEAGRRVTLWTAPGAGHNVGFYYHQKPFDAKRNLVYFVSDRTGSWQLWRAHLGDGRLEQVSEFAGLGRIRRGADVNQHGANYWVYVSPRSGRAYLGGESRIAAIDPDTLDCRILWEARIADDDRTTRFISQSYVFPSCDDRWVYSYAPIPGKMRFLVRDVNVVHFLATGEVKYRDWYESAGEKHVHLHLNIAPDGSFLVGDGQPDCPYICRLDWQENGTIPARPLCRTEYPPPGGVGGMECNPNVHVAPDGKSVYFTTYRDGKACLASVQT